MIESLYCFLIIVILLSFYNIQTLGDDDWCSGVCRLACLDGGVGDLLVRIWIVRRARLCHGSDGWMKPWLRRMDDAMARTDGR